MDRTDPKSATTPNVAEVIALRKRRPADGEPVLTPTFQRLTELLARCHKDRSIGIIKGVPGTSKTTAIRHYSWRWGEGHDCYDGRPQVPVWTASPATTGVGSMLRALAATAMPDACPDGMAMAFKNLRLLREALAPSADGPRLLIVDEAQHLSARQLEQLRAVWDGLHNRGGFGLVLCGNPAFLSQFSNPHSAAFLAFQQFTGRIAATLSIDALDDADLSAIADAFLVEDPDAREMLVLLARKRGGLHSVTRVLRAAAEEAGGRPIRLKHVVSIIKAEGIN